MFAVYFRHALADRSQSVFFALYFIAFAEYACKMSILFYCRNIFFIARSYRKASLALMVISTIWVLASVLTTVMLCQPISAFWTNHHPQIPDPGECSHPWGISFLMVHGVGILIDIAILLLPIRTVFTLQMAKKTKYAVAGIFALGGIVVITNIARLTIEQGAFNGCKRLEPRRCTPGTNFLQWVIHGFEQRFGRAFIF
jgi:hypothetical protein